MTTTQMIDEVRRSLGNRTDIADDRYVRWLNWSLLDICGMHRQRAFPARRFKQLEKTFLFTLPVGVGDAQSATSTTAELAAALQKAGQDDYYNDAVVKVTDYDETAAGADTPDDLLDQERLITDYVAATNTITISEAWDVNPDAYTELSIYRRRYNVLDTSSYDMLDDIYAFQHVQKASDATEIELVDWDELLDISPFTFGEPTKIARRGDEFLLDSCPESALTIRAYVYMFPALFDADEPDADSPLPDNWDEVIVTGAVARGFEKLMEPDRSNEATDKYIELATDRVEESAIMAGHMSKGFRIRRS